MATAALIGCGTVSAAHLAAIREDPRIELIAVCDIDPERRDRTAEAEQVPGYATHQELLAAVRPDVVHVCTPHDQHVPVAIDALDAGVDVLLEKPVAHTLSEARRLAEHAASSSAQVGVCFQNRYNPSSQVVRELLDSGEAGAVRGGAGTVLWSRDAAYYEAAPWRGSWAHSGGGLLINQAIHTLDLLSWFCGDVEQVDGHVSTDHLQDVIEVEDSAELRLSHAGGARSLFFGSNGAVTNLPVTIDIVTENVTAHIRDGVDLHWADGRREHVADTPAAAVPGKAYWGSSHAALIADFYATRETGEKFWIDPVEAMKPLAILNAAYDATYGVDRPGRGA